MSELEVISSNQPEALKIDDMIPELPDLQSKQVIYILTVIKYMQKRMCEPDIRIMNFARAYDTLSKDKNLEHFFNRYTSIYIKVLENKLPSMRVLAGTLFFLDQNYQGKISEAELADILASKFMDENQKKESDKAVKQLLEKEAQEGKV
jgi:hypothetical protein